MQNLPELSVIILTFNEEIHLERCVLSVQPIAQKIYIVDSFSSDRTVEIANNLGLQVIQHPFKSQAEQFQWGLDNLNIQTTWIMRIDADEYLENKLHKEVQNFFEQAHDEIDGIYIKRKVFFEGQWIRHGGFYPHILLRIWRSGKGRIEQRWMDEHTVLPSGAKTILFNEHLVDDNLKGITYWVNKHNQYASREATILLNNKYGLFEKDDGIIINDDPQIKRKRILKEQFYSKLPPVLRAILYFIFRYFVMFGFLDGAKGFLYHFMQGLWYRLLVDIKTMEIEKYCNGDVKMIKQILRKEHGIVL